MRFYISILIISLLFTISSFSKDNTRLEIIKWANFYMNKKYKYNQIDTIERPISKENKKINFDCSGFVNAVYWTAIEKPTIKLQGSTENIHYILSKANKIYKNVMPNIGDIIFFDGTTDPNKKLTHSGIVVNVDKDGTVTYIHSSTSKGPVLGYMNLKYPDLVKKDGKQINSYLRRGEAPYSLASHCFNSYGTVLEKPN
ncbi:NlpC/P60 family protein [Brachyspira intermedia]|uniref:NlpC/P60 family protein n=1 Tax=Brachyspira intermedia TaxID=84377 RepID=UPI003005D5E7